MKSSQLATLFNALSLPMGVSCAAAAPASTPWTFGNQAAQPQAATQAASSSSGKLYSLPQLLWLAPVGAAMGAFPL